MFRGGAQLIRSMRLGPGSVLVENSHRGFCTAGNDAAAEAAQRFLAGRFAGSRGGRFLAKLAENAIKTGISSSTMYGYGRGELACGGTAFVRPMSPVGSGRF